MGCNFTSNIINIYKSVSISYTSQPSISVTGSRSHFPSSNAINAFLNAIKIANIPSVNVGCASGVDYSIVTSCLNHAIHVNYFLAQSTIPSSLLSQHLTLAYQSPSHLPITQRLGIRTTRCISNSCLLVTFGAITGKGTSLAVNTAHRLNIPVIHYNVINNNTTVKHNKNISIF